MCHVAASANRLDIDGIGDRYRIVRRDRRRATRSRRALPRWCRRGTTSCHPRPRPRPYPRPAAHRPGTGRPARTSAHRSRSSVRSPRLSLNAFSPRSAQVQTASRRGASAHSPRRCHPTNPRPLRSRFPSSPGAGARTAPDPPGTSLVGWVTGPDSPNKTIKRFADHRHRPRDHVGQRRSRQPSGADGLRRHLGYCSVHGKQWRYNVLFRSQDRALSKTVSMPNGVVDNKYSGSPLWAPASLQTDRQQHQVGARSRPESFPPPASPSADDPVHQLHVHQELGQSRGVDNELLGDRGVP